MASAEERSFITALEVDNDMEAVRREGVTGDENEEGQQFLPDVHQTSEKSTLHALVDSLEKKEPRDRFHIVYFILVIHGIGILMPWNMFITAKSYFEDYKLDQGNQTTEAVKEYRTNFMSYIGTAAQFPNVLMCLLNLFCQCGGKSGVRIVCSIIVMIVVFIITIVFAMIDTSDWPETFFWLTIASAIVVNSAGGVYQSSMFGVAAILPRNYSNAVIFGCNMSGTFVASVNILVIALAPDIRTSAVYYFVTAVVVLLIAFDAYFALPLTHFFRHFKQLTKWKRQLAQTSHKDTCSHRLSTYWKVLKQIWVMALSVWFVFFISLALFPQIQSDVKRIDIPIADTYWTPVFCYLSFNFFAMLGNIVTELWVFPREKFVWIPVLLRVLFVPLYLFFNVRPDSRQWPVFLGNDYVYIFVSILMAFSHGYFSSVCMIYGPQQVEKKDAGIAGMMMAFFLVFGILCGVNASRFLVFLLE